MRVIYRSSLGENILISPATIKKIKTITTCLKQVKGDDGRLTRIPYEFCDVVFVTFLPHGQVLYRRRFSGPQDENVLFEIAHAESVIEKLKACGHFGPFDDLEALLPTKPNIENRPNGPNVLSKPGRKSTAEASERASNEVRLARAYVEWVEKLPDDELMLIFGHGRRALCPRRAMAAFKSHDREKGLKLGVTSRADERIRRIIESDTELNARFSSVIARARSLTKD